MPKPKSSSPNRRKNRNKQTKLKEEMIYFEGRVVETFPGTIFGVAVVRKAGLAPLIIKASLKAMLIKRRVMVIRGDKVTVEINPEDLATEGMIRGTIVERINIPMHLQGLQNTSTASTAANPAPIVPPVINPALVNPASNPAIPNPLVANTPLIAPNPITK